MPNDANICAVKNFSFAKRENAREQLQPCVKSNCIDLISFTNKAANCAKYREGRQFFMTYVQERKASSSNKKRIQLKATIASAV